MDLSAYLATRSVPHVLIAAEEIPEFITVDGKQRPTYNSEGRMIHPTIRGIKNFWRWFGGSRVIDSDGRPLVVYHGTKDNFDVFDPNYRPDGRPSGNDPTAYLGSHFAETAHIANMFADGMYGANKHNKNGGSVLPCYIRVNVPATYDSEFKLRNEICSLEGHTAGIDEELERYADDIGVDIDEIYKKYEESASFRVKVNESVLKQDQDLDEIDDSLAVYLGGTFKDNLQDTHHDGIRYANAGEGGFAWVVFSPHQVKSAIGNRGDFGGSNEITASEDYQDDTEYNEDHRTLTHIGLIFVQPSVSGTGIKVSYNGHTLTITPDKKEVTVRPAVPSKRGRKHVPAKVSYVPSYLIYNGIKTANIPADEAEQWLRGLKVTWDVA